MSVYYNTKKWVGIINKKYNVALNSKQIHRLFQHFKVRSVKNSYNNNITLYNFDDVDMLMRGVRKNEFIQAINDISNNKDITKPLKIDIKNFDSDDIDDNEEKLYYDNNENDMEKYSDYLINHIYQTESFKKVLLKNKIKLQYD